MEQLLATLNGLSAKDWSIPKDAKIPGAAHIRPQEHQFTTHRIDLLKHLLAPTLGTYTTLTMTLGQHVTVPTVTGTALRIPPSLRYRPEVGPLAHSRVSRPRQPAR